MNLEDVVAGVHESWRPFLDAQKDLLATIVAAVTAESEAGHDIAPEPHAILRAFHYPADAVRALIVGQDPYPTPGHAMGLAFSVNTRTHPLPRSLVNIFRELRDDLGIATPENGDLSAWAESGVMLLNRSLTVRTGHAGSLRHIGWDTFTAAAIRYLADRGTPLVAILWGADAQRAAPLLGPVPIVASAHPSPLSAHRGFFGSRPFSRANALLREHGGAPIDWGSVSTARHLHS